MPSDSFVWHVLTNLLLTAFVLLIVGCCLAILATILGLERRRPRADIGRVSLRWLDERGRNRRPE